MQNVKFIKSAVWPEDYPESARPEIAMVGRSNAGKSSLLNAMVGTVKIAKVSSTPGKTRLINFFEVGQHYTLVDLPGYGFAVKQDQERKAWDKMMTLYFAKRPQLVGLLLVCDARRVWTEEESWVFELAQARQLKILTVLTKIDKLTRNEWNKSLDAWIKTSGFDKSFFTGISSLKGQGVKELENTVFKEWIKRP